MDRDRRRRHRVLVLDGEQRAALAVARSLGAAGYRVSTGSASRRSLAGASRYSSASEWLPDPLADPAAYLAAVRTVVAQDGYSVVVPVTEPSALALLGEPALESLIPMPSAHTFAAVNDKVALLTRASALGVAVPGFETLSAADDPAAIGWATFPAVMKPARSVVGDGATRRKTQVQFVDDVAELAAVLAALAPDAFPVMLQERFQGPGIGVFLLLDRGELVASFCHRRIREKPPEGGVSVYRESIRAPAELVPQATTLLRSYEWTGVAMVEFKLDEPTGRYGLMEINGRFWGSLQLAIDAGVDFPRLLVDRFLGLGQEECPDYRVGIRSRWEWGDVDHLLIRMRRGGGGGGLLAWFRPWWPGDRFEVFRLSDPRPFLAESRSWIRDAFGRGGAG